MIHHIQGKLVEKYPTHVVIDCHGVGYFINISLHTFSQIKDAENLKLLTHFLVREDAHLLFGFAEPVEREIFKLLLSVSGVGANTARTILSSMTPHQLRDAIITSNAVQIQTVKGIGAKTAQRIILDLKDKIIKTFGTDDVSENKNNTIKNEALSALEVLGYPKKQTEKIVDKIVSESPDGSLEMVIKVALKNL
ncbi:MAG: Holliday junction branch migration protein RuvA [Flavobacteriales bacterium CG_4_9_14_3_um_filter_40_17]|nr:MAG: Holliday junction branch migration protein RuvA [Flavobacteriales bacterium CG_4_9_14_3_um_filter_40_17]